jgi:formamidopyrimidine-DNA glycosylase
MPELPEVETIKNDLKKAVLNKRIVGVSVFKKTVVKSFFADFIKTLKKNNFKDISRIGKLLIFHLENKKYLLIHLKMTGQLIYCVEDKCIAGGHEVLGSIGKLPNKYSHVIFNFQDDSTLYFNDMRRFGYMKIVSEDELKKIKNKFGIEPLTRDFVFKKFKEIFKNKKTSIKAALMDQALISGIGNIYADEILFKAGVMPTRIAASLEEEELKKIFNAANEILKKAIKMRGTTFSNYVDSKGKKGNFSSMLKVYGREGEKCFRCGGVVKKIKLAGRGTRFCEKCQK